MRYILGFVCLAFTSAILAAASSGLKWTATATYEDGTPIEAAQQVVYLVFDASNKQVASTRETTLAGSKLPADGCYYLRSALYAADTNSIVPNSQSLGVSNMYCIKAPQKRVAAPASVGGQ